jgi:hypothetical protein
LIARAPAMVSADCLRWRPSRDRPPRTSTHGRVLVRLGAERSQAQVPSCRQITRPPARNTVRTWVPSGYRRCRNVQVATAVSWRRDASLRSGFVCLEGSAAWRDRHGKEGVAGSSPAEGSSESRRIGRRFRCSEASRTDGAPVVGHVWDTSACGARDIRGRRRAPGRGRVAVVHAAARQRDREQPPHRPGSCRTGRDRADRENIPSGRGGAHTLGRTSGFDAREVDMSQ